MKKIMMVLSALILIISLSGCFRYTPTQREYTKFIPPENTEAKKCIIECEKIKLMEQQLAAQWKVDWQLESLACDIAEGKYETCYENCGGKTEKAIGTW